MKPIPPTDRYNVVSEESVAVEMRDGIVLRADVHRPSSAGRWPVLLRRTPYDKRRTTMADHLYLASHGFVVVAQDVRGRHASGGEWHSMFQDDRNTLDAEDGFDTAAWAGQLRYSNGDIIAWGHSYDAWCAFQMATARPPALRGIYAGGMTVRSKDFNFGFFETGRRMEWTAVMAIDAIKRATGATKVKTNEAVVDLFRNIDRYKWLWFTPVSDLPEWSFGPLTPSLKALFRDSNKEFFHLLKPDLCVIPTIHVSGTWDRFSRNADNRRLLGQVGDSSSHRVGFGPRGQNPVNLAFDGLPAGYQTPESVRGEDILLDWARRILGLERPGTGGPPVWYFLLGGGEWRATEAWPPPGSVECCFYLGAKNKNEFGLLDREPTGGASATYFRYDPRDPNMYLGGIEFQDAPIDLTRYPKHPDTLTFTSPPFEAAMEVAGSPTLELWAATSAPDTDWAAVLTHCLADGPEILLSPAIVRARYRHGAEARPVDEGVPFLYHLEFRPTAVLFRPGDRLRLDISSSLFPGFARNHNTGVDPFTDSDFVIAEQTVLHSTEYPSLLRLPVVSQGPSLSASSVA
jgi:putative CocE/NonD family hydrolase